MSVLKTCKEHIASKALLSSLVTCAIALMLAFLTPISSYAEGGAISIKASSDAYTIVFHAFRIADQYANPLIPAATEDELSARPEFEGKRGKILMAAVLEKAAEDEAFAAEFASILEAADSSLPRAEIKSDIDPVLVEDGWYALSGTRMYKDGRTQPTPLIVLEVRGELVSMEEKPLDELPPPDSNENENENKDYNGNKNYNDDIYDKNVNENKIPEKQTGDAISVLGDHVNIILIAVIAGVALGLVITMVTRRNRRE